MKLYFGSQSLIDIIYNWIRFEYHSSIQASAIPGLAVSKLAA